MAGRKKLFHNYLIERCIKGEKDGMATYSFANLKENEIPTIQNIGSIVYHAQDIHKKKFIPYKIKSVEIRNDMFIFTVNDFYRTVKDGETTESLGAIRSFYQADLVIIPEDYLSKKHRSVS